MTNSKKGFAALLGVMLVTALACDPYAEANKADPTVVRVLAIRPAGGGAYPPAPLETNAPTSGTTWDLTGVCGARASSLAPTAQCNPYGFTTTRGRQVIGITFNQQLDGATVQTSPGDCTPASTLTITAVDATTSAPVPQAGAFRACYQPGGIEGEGGSILVFVGSSPTSNRPDLGLALTPNTRYTVVGSGLVDQNGKSVGFTANVTTVASEALWTAPGASSASTCYYTYPSPGQALVCKTPGAPWYTGVTVSSVTVNWAAIPGATGYFIDRALDIGGIPGSFTTLNATAVAGTTYTDNTVAASTIYWYLVTATDGTLFSPGGDFSSVTTPLSGPAAPTFGTVTATSAVLNWTAVAGASGYIVEQADDSFGVNAGFAPLFTTPIAGTTFTVTGLTTATPYWFRVDAVNATGSSSGEPATVTTP